MSMVNEMLKPEIFASIAPNRHVRAFSAARLAGLRGTVRLETLQMA